ncbi:PREDICTED: uncharacterized protein LOC108564142 [Nicrophorus vespilloides]|uniref:Uncharacterized protein LOC108564142 n=1 Tax=Nicrophorus vespilloides TaxID=110193 RepID=A0ABM1MVG8_NICVS|nr:PREDICTED: uncharacterized protein LOC108564142 [Nicrophorus vespilloides]
MAAAAMAEQKIPEVYGAETWYRELGYYITSRKEQYERACRYFDQAVEKAPMDKRALIGRSITRAKSVQYEGAMEDINKALDIEEGNLVAEALKSLYTYLICNFEDGLVENLRCLPIRKKPDNFAMGVMHCNEAIENCLGQRAGRPLRDHFKIIRKLAWKKAKESQKPFELRTKRKKKKKKKKKKETEEKHMEALVPLKKKRGLLNVSDLELKIFDSLYSLKEEMDIIPPGPKFPYRPLQDYTSNIENYMASKYLESMYLDKIFLKNLKDDPGVKNPNKSSTRKIILIAKHGFKTLSYKQELLRIRRPFYFIKFQETTLLSATLLARQIKEDERVRKAVILEANALLSKIESCIENKQTRDALETAEKLKLLCETKEKRYFPNRQEFVMNIYQLVCRAHLELKRLNKNQCEGDQEKRIFNMLGYPLSKQVSKDSVLRECKRDFIDWNKQISIAENRVRNARDAQELAWLYHDLSRYYTEIRQYELGRVYARKCIAEAKECGEKTWFINATLLIVRINMQLRNKTDAKQELNQAIDIATEMENENLLEYLHKTMDVVEKFSFDDTSSKVYEKREKQIVDMMAGANLKGEVEHLFRQMAAMPVSRRMSVMPGVRFDDSKNKKVSGAVRMSIMPTSKSKEDEFKPKSAMKKKKIMKKTDESGAEFIKLIQHINGGQLL